MAYELHAAIEKRSDVSELQELMKRGADINEVQPQSQLKPIQLAALKGTAAAFVFLADLGANLESEDEDGNLLFLVTREEDADSRKIIDYLTAPERINIQIKNGITPLHVAVIKGDLSRIQDLLELDPASLATRGIKDYTALHWAAEAINERTLVFLMTHSAFMQFDLFEKENLYFELLDIFLNMDLVIQSEKCINIMLTACNELPYQNDIERDYKHRKMVGFLMSYIDLLTKQAGREEDCIKIYEFIFAELKEISAKDEKDIERSVHVAEKLIGLYESEDRKINRNDIAMFSHGKILGYVRYIPNANSFRDQSMTFQQELPLPMSQENSVSDEKESDENLERMAKRRKLQEVPSSQVPQRLFSLPNSSSGKSDGMEISRTFISGVRR